MASESFSLALQQRAAREVVSEEMPRRALATRLLLFCEITSALLIVELGLFAHILAMAVALIIVPMLLAVRMGLYVVGMGFYAYAALCLGVRWSLRVRWNDGCSSHSRDLPFASIFTNPRYSSFGLRRGQKGNSLNALTIIVARVACASVLVHMALNACGAKQHPQNLYQCKCLYANSGKCEAYALLEFNSTYGIGGSFGEELTRERCSNFEHLAPDQTSKEFEVQFCSATAVKLPDLMQGTCQAGHMDPVEYFYCRKQSWYVGYCNARFRVCAMFLEASESLDTFILQVCCIAPPFSLALMVLIHLAGFIVAKQTNQPSLMNVSENRELRLRIRRKACHFERQLQKEQLEHSIWWGRRCLEMNLLFFLVDISSDFFVLCNYFSAGTEISDIFGCCQLGILLVGFLYQFWCTSFRKLFLATCESWNVGMPCNRLQKVLMKEKTIEAPLSLFLQYFSAFYLNGSLLSLSLSMLSSIFGIANSFYISRHLAVQEYDDVDDETVMKNGPVVCVVGAGEARLPPPPGLSGADGKAKLPPPPGIKLPAPPGLNPILPAQSNGRKPGQFASATE